MAGVMMTEVMAINGDVIFFRPHIILTAIVLGGKVSLLMAGEDLVAPFINSESVKKICVDYTFPITPCVKNFCPLPAIVMKIELINCPGRRRS